MLLVSPGGPSVQGLRLPQLLTGVPDDLREFFVSATAQLLINVELNALRHDAGEQLGELLRMLEGHDAKRRNASRLASRLRGRLTVLLPNREEVLKEPLGQFVTCAGPLRPAGRVAAHPLRELQVRH